jgi:hypothetical protein
MRVRVVLLSLVLLAGCRTTYDPWFRRPEPRASKTIFSPLDLPAPNAQREGSGAPGPGYWQQQVDYSIDATVEPETREVTGKGRVTYHNNSPDTLTTSAALEQNSFRDDGLASAVTGRGPDGKRRGGTEGYTLEPMHTVEGAELKFAPMDLVGRLDLPAPLPPGGTFAWDMAWTFHVPAEARRRMGLEKVEQGTDLRARAWFLRRVYDDVYGWNSCPTPGAASSTRTSATTTRITVPRNTSWWPRACSRTRRRRTRRAAEALGQRARRRDRVIRDAEEVARRPPRRRRARWLALQGRQGAHLRLRRQRSFIVDAASLDGTPSPRC